jgi:hypothetical protein
MLETLGTFEDLAHSKAWNARHRVRRVCLMVVKNSRPTVGNGRPRSAAAGCTRRSDLSDADHLGAGKKAIRTAYN